MLSDILIDAKALIDSFNEFIQFENSLDFNSFDFEQDGAKLSSSGGLVTLYINPSKVTVFARSDGLLTNKGTKFRAPLLLLLKHYFPNWQRAEDWLADFLESDRRFVGLSTESRAIAFRKSDVGIFVDVEKEVQSD